MDCAKAIELSLSALLVVGTFILSIVTVCLVRETRAGAKKQLEVNTWLEFVRRFDTPQMDKARAVLAGEVSQSLLGKEIPLGISEEVLEFFEELGIAYEQKCIHKKLTHSSFSYDAQNWWFLVKPHVDKMRREQKEELYCDYETLLNLMRSDFSRDPEVTAESAQKYLNREMKRAFSVIDSDPNEETLL